MFKSVPKSGKNTEKPKRTTPDPAAKKSAISVKQTEVEILQLSPLCPCDGGCPRCDGAGQPGSDNWGKPLSDSARGFFEPRFNKNFEDVRIHTGVEADRLNRNFGALAFTKGTDIFFRNGQLDTNSQKGKKLLAHELTHVVQQGAGSGVPDIQRVTEEQLLDSLTWDRAREMSIPELEQQVETLSRQVDAGVAPRGTSLERMRRDLRIYQQRLEAERQRLVEEERRREEARIQALVDQQLAAWDQYNTPGGWHNRFPRSPDDELTITPGSSERVERDDTTGLVTSRTPQIPPVLDYPSPPGLAPIEDTTRSRARTQYLARIRGRLDRVQRHTPGGGDLRVHHRGGGYAYRSSEYRHSVVAAGEHETFESRFRISPPARRAAGLAAARAIGIDLATVRLQNLWGVFIWLLDVEGDTCAINAWDRQILTIGPGFSAHSRDAGRIYAEMPDEFQQHLYHHGIFIDRDTYGFLVLDLRRGVVESDDDALRIIAADQQRLSLLIDAAMSTRTAARGSQTLQWREWLLRTQWERYLARNRGVPLAILTGWPENLRRFAFRLRHWMTSLQWGQLTSCGSPPGTRPTAQELAALARTRAMSAMGMSAAAAEAQIQRQAHTAGVGTVF